MNRLYVSSYFERGSPVGTHCYLVLCSDCAGKRFKLAEKKDELGDSRLLEEARRKPTEEPCIDCGASGRLRRPAL